MKRTIATPSGGRDERISAEEEQRIRDEWEVNKVKKEKNLQEEIAKKEAYSALKVIIQSKLGLTYEEINFLCGDELKAD